MVRGGGEALATTEQQAGSFAPSVNLVEAPTVSPEEQARILESPLLKGIHIIGIREGGLVDCWVPVERIDNEEVPVHEAWAKSLAKQMDREAKANGGTGQYTPVSLGLIEGEDLLKIMDGFHRSAALEIKGESFVYSTVKLTDWDGLFDMRIFTAKDHAHVRFSRVVQWIREVWQFSGLQDKMTVEQAILLYRFKSSGARLGLTEEEVEKSNAWVSLKEQQWDMPAMTFHGYLQIAEHVDPKLVHATRDKTDSKSLTAPTQAILKVFSEKLPDRFELQNIAMEAAMAGNLRGPQVKTICAAIAHCETAEAARAVIAGINLESVQSEYSETTRKALRRAHDPRFKGAIVLDKALAEIERVAERTGLILEREEDVDDEMKAKVAEAESRVEDLQIALGELQLKLAQVKAVEYAPKQPRKRGGAAKAAPKKAPAAKATPAASSSSSKTGPAPRPPAPAPAAKKAPAQPARAEKAFDTSIPHLDRQVSSRPASSRPAQARTEGATTDRPTAEESRAAAPPPASPERGVLQETDASKAMKASIVKILNGGKGEFPPLRTRLDIRRAEEVLEQGGFRGSRAIQEELADQIDEAKQRIRDRIR